MATYAIGDIQGCFDALQSLLKIIEFNAARDRLYLVGDLVNRGPKSLEVLQWAMEMEERVTTVLGNHDLHFLGRYFRVSPQKSGDTLEKLLASPQVDKMARWLCHRPLIHDAADFAVVHAGFLPHWDWEIIRKFARQTEKFLRGPEAPQLIATIHGKKDLSWFEPREGLGQLGAFLKILTRLRVCDEEGTVHFRFTGPPEQCPASFRPWFDWPHQREDHKKIIFGHWSALGLYHGAGVLGLDSGCVWGRELTAYRLEDGETFQVFN